MMNLRDFAKKAVRLLVDLQWRKLPDVEGRCCPVCQTIDEHDEGCELDGLLQAGMKMGLIDRVERP